MRSLACVSCQSNYHDHSDRRGNPRVLDRGSCRNHVEEEGLADREDEIQDVVGGKASREPLTALDYEVDDNGGKIEIQGQTIMLLRPFREARYKLPCYDIGSYEDDLNEEDAVDFANEAQPVGLFALLHGTLNTFNNGIVSISSNIDGWADAFLHLLLLQVCIDAGLTHLPGWLLGQFEVWRAVVAAV